MTHAFPKSEHLCSRSEIERLFSAGSRSATVFPVRAVYRVSHDIEGKEPAIKAMVSVAKRRMHHAVDRNRAKRQLREAYRLHKDTLMGVLQTGESIHIGWIWLAEKPCSSNKVESAICTLIERIANNLKDGGHCL